MNKNLLITLLVFGLIGCATSNLYISEEPRMPNTTYGSWTYSIINDEFNGRYTRSSVLSDDGKGLIEVIYSEKRKDYRINYINGDSYICVVDYSTPVQFKFYNGAGAGILNVPFNKFEDSTGLGTRTFSYVHELLDRFRNANRLLVRTTDDCGTTIDRTFRLSGTPHLIPRVKGESNIPVLWINTYY